MDIAAHVTVTPSARVMTKRNAKMKRPSTRVPTVRHCADVASQACLAGKDDKRVAHGELELDAKVGRGPAPTDAEGR